MTLLAWIAAWIIVTVCTYLLWFSRFDKVAKEHGGIIEYFRLWMEKDDVEYKLLAESFHPAALKSTVLVFCLFGWPVMLLQVGKSYFYDYSKAFKEELK